MNDDLHDSVTWASTLDHSKWCIQKGRGSYLVCLGDMNRMESQRKRGGGAFCTYDERLWNVLSKVISQVEECEALTVE